MGSERDYMLTACELDEARVHVCELVGFGLHFMQVAPFLIVC